MASTPITLHIETLPGERLVTVRAEGEVLVLAVRGRNRRLCARVIIPALDGEPVPMPRTFRERELQLRAELEAA